MRPLLVLLALLAPTAAHAQIDVVASYPAEREMVFLGAADLDGDGTPETVHGAPSGYYLGRLVIRDGRTGTVEWTSDGLGDARLAVAGWAGARREHLVDYQSEGDDTEYPVTPLRFGESPFADVDGDGVLELVVYNAADEQLIIVGRSDDDPPPN